MRGRSPGIDVTVRTPPAGETLVQLADLGVRQVLDGLQERDRRGDDHVATLAYLPGDRGSALR
jgi:hypothetical protein